MLKFSSSGVGEHQVSGAGDYETGQTNLTGGACFLHRCEVNSHC